LDGKNFLRVTDLLGRRLQQVLMHHFKKFQVLTGIGGLKLMRDATEYQEFMKKTASSNATVSLFTTLKDIAKLFIVDPSELSSLLFDSSLQYLDREEVTLFVKQRSDFKTHWLETILLSTSSELPQHQR